jgi:predicted phosphodiesterase
MAFLPSLLLGVIAAVAAEPTLLVQPYVQPGPQGTLGATDEVKVIWIAEPTTATFTLEYAPKGLPPAAAKIARTEFEFTPPPAKALTPAEKPQQYVRFVASLPGLTPNTEYTYVLRSGGKVLAERTARARKTPDQPTRLLLVGDLADGKTGQNTIAYRIAQEKPDALVALGDIVYPSGRSFHYFKHYWPTYVNVAEASEKTGAPLMATIPFYAVLGNHDAYVGKLSPTLTDAFAAYYFFTAPQNGPGEGAWTTQLPKSEEGAKLRRLAGATYPALDFYSFDYGPAHVVVLSNASTGKGDDPKVATWVEQDLKASKQPWKIVCLHAPPFQVTTSHYGDQRSRKLAPIFEAQGVDVVFAGHVHNYQRSKPFKFSPHGTIVAAKPEDPKEAAKAEPSGAPKIPPSYVNGAFTIDDVYDATGQTRPKGVIYIVAGGGGAKLYTGTVDKNLAKLPNGGKDNYAPFNAKLYDTQHSFAVLDLTAKRFELRAVNAKGEEIDRFTLQK